MDNQSVGVLENQPFRKISAAMGNNWLAMHHDLTMVVYPENLLQLLQPDQLQHVAYVMLLEKYLINRDTSNYLH
ncbi:hypothetical protein D3C83_50110 [compost metagenome]